MLKSVGLPSLLILFANFMIILMAVKIYFFDGGFNVLGALIIITIYLDAIFIQLATNKNKGGEGYE